MKENIKISIITATYNSASTLPDTLLSILNQTYQNIECIIIDGLSTDNTINIIKDFETRYPGRIIWQSEMDRGIYDAMNKGIKLATGDVIGILNSDDYFTDNLVVEKISSSFKESNIEAIYGDIHFVDSSDIKKNVRYYSSKFFRPALMRFGFMPAHPSFYVRKYCYDKYGCFNLNYKIGADFELLLRLIFINRINIHYLKMDFVTMRIGGISTSGFSSHKQIMKDHIRACKENKVYTNIALLSLRYLYKIVEVIYSKIIYYTPQVK